MKVLDINFNPWYAITIEINWPWIICILCVLFGFYFIIKHVCVNFKVKSVQVEEITLGLGNQTITLKYDLKDREIAYKLWIEMSTRKIAVPFDEKNDVIIEVYDSWYTFFSVARDLIEEVPVKQFDKSSQLIELTLDILNNCLRSNLTKWQAKFRKWYNEAFNSDEYKNYTPQEIQKQYPDYCELIHDIKTTNDELIHLRELMREIAFDKK